MFKILLIQSSISFSQCVTETIAALTSKSQGQEKAAIAREHLKTLESALEGKLFFWRQHNWLSGHCSRLDWNLGLNCRGICSCEAD